MGKFDEVEPFFDEDDLDEYVAIDREIAKRYGKTVKAIELANLQYKFRYQKLKDQRKMKPPPSTGRIFLGYLVVRKVGTDQEYETWMPDMVFDDLYEKA